VLVTSAATLIESVPFVLAGAVIQRLPFRWNARVVPYLGCGCGTGPSARSLPAAAATWLVFGPIVAALRVFAAIAVERISKRSDCAHNESGVLNQLALIAPLATSGAVFTLFASAIVRQHASPAIAFFSGAGLGFAIAPCGLGAVGLAAIMRAAMPAGAAGFLCVAGIVDLRTLLRGRHLHAQHDAFAYAMSGVVCAVVAMRGGAAIVHPKLALLLWPCACALLVFAYRYRTEANARLRVAPIIMLAGAVLAAPPPVYHATETTLADAFPGERLDFTGEVTRTGDVTTLVRYAITCCRADAAPIVVRLDRNPHNKIHGWARARGILEIASNGLRLHVTSFEQVAAPADPFVYR
jgi:hypothetical protein